MINQQSLANRLFILLGFIIIIYMLFYLATSIYKDYKLEQQLTGFKNENLRIEKEIKEKESDYLYFLSPQYKDKYAKENLGLINKGEKVIIIPPQEKENILSPEKPWAKKKKEISQMPNLEQWYEYFFGTR